MNIAPPVEYELSRAVAAVVAEFLDVGEESIVHIEIDSERARIEYGVRIGPGPEGIHTRARVIDSRTGRTISDEAV